jgi:hypothetical protein
MTETADRIAVSLVTDPAWTDNGHYVAQALWTSAAKVATARAQVAELCPNSGGPVCVWSQRLPTALGQIRGESWRPAITA